MRRNKKVSGKLGKVWCPKITLTLNFVKKPTRDSGDSHMSIHHSAKNGPAVQLKRPNH